MFLLRMRLSGWQRLLIVLSVVWFGVFFGLALVDRITALNEVDAEFHSCERVISKLERSNWRVCLDYRRDARRAANAAWLPVFLIAIVPIPIFWLLGWIVFRFSRWVRMKENARFDD
jgi:hypothetical protein